jgi:hypothetical protein
MALLHYDVNDVNKTRNWPNITNVYVNSASACIFIDRVVTLGGIRCPCLRASPIVSKKILAKLMSFLGD